MLIVASKQNNVLCEERRNEGTKERRNEGTKEEGSCSQYLLRHCCLAPSSSVQPSSGCQFISVVVKGYIQVGHIMYVLCAWVAGTQ